MMTSGRAVGHKEVMFHTIKPRKITNQIQKVREFWGDCCGGSC
jgi:hypothetical protein